jgi:trans-2,3-dihydro-3-hydroxyanthranilate isomerase
MTTTMSRRFVTVDVFTTTPFSGNPLAVVLDTEGLSTSQMQAIAREFNYVETAFILPPVDPVHTARVRIFTTTQELPFAGHPNVGTAFVLARRGEAFGRKISHEVAFEEKAGLVPVKILREQGEVVGAELTAPEPFRRGTEIDPVLVAAAVSLPVGDVSADRHVPIVASVGLPFVIAELRSRDALCRIQPDPAALAEVFKRGGVTGLHIYTCDTGLDDTLVELCDLRARMVFRVPMVVEDPATGSANCALVALLAQLAPEPNTTLERKVLQGLEMGRPSVLNTRAHKQRGIIDTVHVGGRCVEVMAGTLL